MKTPNELRIEVANSQRMKKTRENWLKLADRLNNPSWQDKSEHEGSKIGDNVGFIERKGNGQSFSFTQKYGTAFAFNESFMVVVYLGELKRISLD